MQVPGLEDYFFLGRQCHKQIHDQKSKSLGDIATLAKVIAAQERFLDFLLRVVLGNRIVFHYLLAEEGGV